MASKDNWETFLDGHPIFSKTRPDLQPLNLSINSLKESQNVTAQSNDVSGASRRRQLMCMKDLDLILAVDSEIRMASLNERTSGGSQKSYKVLHAPCINFDIHQIRLSPNKKLLAVAGAYKIAIIVLPGSGFSKLVTSRVDCKALRIGAFYHAEGLSPIAKIDWHPWGESGSTLLVMTIDGKLREYDVSRDPEEPGKTTDFIPERKRGVFIAQDDSEREVASFTFGKGKADWGPLTIYALMRSGDVYAVCPYLPTHALIPSSYLHALECYISAKEEFVHENAAVDESFSLLYDYQRKFINGLMKHAPSDLISSPSSTRLVPVHAPKTLAGKVSRQGPFLLQPAPLELKDSPGGDATDIAYLTLGSAFADDDDESSVASERLGVILLAYQDGRVDVCLDVEKIEARWDVRRPSSNDLPMLAVYEVIDLGLLSEVSDDKQSREISSGMIERNHTVFYSDPIHDDTIYAYHCFGVHVLNLNPIFQNIAAAIKDEAEEKLQETIKNHANTAVQPILRTTSFDRRSSNPVTSVVIPDDVYRTYSIFILTASLRLVTFALTLRAENIEPQIVHELQKQTELPPLPPSSGPSTYNSILSAQTFVIPAALTRTAGLPPIPKISLTHTDSGKTEMNLTPETLRYLATVSERICSEIREAQISCIALKNRTDIQKQEFERLQKAASDIINRAHELSGPRKTRLQEKMKAIQEEQKTLLARMDRVLRTLIKNASPELNEHETRWFEELERMKAQVQGVGRFDQDSLRSRIRLLENDLERVVPSLKELAKKEEEDASQSPESVWGAGRSYAKAYARLSEEESQKLDDAVRQITRLAKTLDITSITQPPS